MRGLKSPWPNRNRKMDQQRLEARLADRFGAAHAVLLGRGRSAIAAVCETVGLAAGSWLVMPATICPSLVAVAYSLGLKVAPVDIDPASGLATDAAMSALVQELDGPGMVMPTHLYGFLADYPNTVAAAKTRGWFVLENDTAGIRATDIGRGMAGDALVVSFGGGKVIDAGGGGAVLTNNAEFAAALRACTLHYPIGGAEADGVEDWLVKVRRMLRQGPQCGPSYADRYEYLIDIDAGQVRFQFNPRYADALAAALDTIAVEADRRRAQHAAWASHLARLGSRIIIPSSEVMVPWRFIARLPKIRDAAVAELRAAGLDAGTNYPPITAFFPRQLASWILPGADIWGQEVINLWLDRRYGAGEMELAAATLDRLAA